MIDFYRDNKYMATLKTDRSTAIEYTSIFKQETDSNWNWRETTLEKYKSRNK